MKREIIFRGERKDGKGLVYGDLRQTSEGCYISSNISCEKLEPIFVLEPIKPETIGQFTGLTDKNGVKIFENDILDNNEIVTYSNGCFMTSIGALALSVNHREIID